jgi:two-component system, LytTR family, response regulator LytT
MNCVIIEDEQHAASYLTYLIEHSEHKLNIMATIESVSEAIEWLKHNKIDLIFLDIQLGDGNSFAIFESIQLNTPIIFTTSYSNYAIDAFKLNSIAYLLKPIEQADLNKALSKLNGIYNLMAIPKPLEPTKKFLVQLPNSLRLIEDHDISYFMVQNRHVFIVLNSGEQLLYANTLDSLETSLNAKEFFRINRQFIVRSGAIQKMHMETRGRVRIETIASSKEDMIVSIDRAAQFKDWIQQT